MSAGKIGNLVFLECISNILEQKLEFLNRTRTSLNLSFFIQGQHMNTFSFFFKFTLRANTYEPLILSV